MGSVADMVMLSDRAAQSCLSEARRTGDSQLPVEVVDVFMPWRRRYLGIHASRSII